MVFIMLLRLSAIIFFSFWRTWNCTALIGRICIVRLFRIILFLTFIEVVISTSLKFAGGFLELPGFQCRDNFGFPAFV